MPGRLVVVLFSFLVAGASGCRMQRAATKNFAELFRASAKVPHRIEHPRRADAGLAVLWVGHATVLLQMDDKFILTDPVFTSTVGQLSKRLTEPGISPDAVPPIDAVLISHLHFDHLSYGSLEMLERKIRRIVVPEHGLVYLPDFAFDAMELPVWRSYEESGMRVTAVPVRHVGWRYGTDAAWMTKSFCGYVIEYNGMTVYYGGDTGYEAPDFAAARARFPHIDVAILPIGPIAPRAFMEHNHEDPDEAVRAFLALGARWMVPIHYDTFINSTDAPGEAPERLVIAARASGVSERVAILGIGEQRVFLPRALSHALSRP